VLVSSVDFVDFDVLPRIALRSSSSVPAHHRHSRDRQQVAATLELAVAELREHGIPRRVATSEPRRERYEAAVLFTAEPARVPALARRGVGTAALAKMSSGGSSGTERGVVRRSVVQDSQRSLYGLELFSSSTSRRSIPRSRSRRCARASPSSKAATSV